MKVTTFFGHGSSGGGGVMHGSGVGPGKVNQGHSNTQEIHNVGFVPVASSSTANGGGIIMPVAPPAVERASSEVLYSSITPRYGLPSHSMEKII